MAIDVVFFLRQTSGVIERYEATVKEFGPNSDEVQWVARLLEKEIHQLNKVSYQVFGEELEAVQAIVSDIRVMLSVQYNVNKRTKAINT